MAREESIEAKMKNILADVASIDEKAKRLAKQREKLMLAYEKLKDAKIIKDAQTSILEQNWQEGMYIENNFQLKRTNLKNSFFYPDNRKL